MLVDPELAERARKLLRDPRETNGKGNMSALGTHEITAGIGLSLEPPLSPPVVRASAPLNSGPDPQPEVPDFPPTLRPPEAPAAEPVAPAPAPAPAFEPLMAPAPAEPAPQPEPEPEPVVLEAPTPQADPLPSMAPPEPEVPTVAPEPAPDPTPLIPVNAPPPPSPAPEPAPEPAPVAPTQLPELDPIVLTPPEPTPAEPPAAEAPVEAPAELPTELPAELPVIDPFPPAPLADPAPPAPVEQPLLGTIGHSRGAYRVVVRLTDGDGVDVGVFNDFGTAMEGAQEVIEQFANANGSWPFYAGRFIRPDLIVSVDVVDA
jgi:hypothetical protein